MSDKRFDDILKQKLTEHKVKMSGDEWNLMHDILNEDSDFDQLFKEKLREHPMAYEPGSWDSLVSKLDGINHSEMDEKQFDQNLANKLSSSTITYKESHWQILKEKLEFQKELKQKIVITKVTEVAILVLLLFSFLTIQPFERFTKPSKGPVAIKLDQSINTHSSESVLVKADEAVVVLNDSNESILKESFVDEAIVKDKSEVQKAISNDAPVVFSKLTSPLSSIVKLPTVNPSLKIISQEVPIQLKNTLDESDVKVFDPFEHSNTKEGFIEQFPVIQKIINPDKTEINKPFIESTQKSITAIPNPVKALMDHPASDIVHSALKNIHFASIGQRESILKSSKETGLLAEPKLAALIPIKSPKKIGQRWIGIIASLDYNIIDRPLNFKLILEPEKFGVYGTSLGIQYAHTKGHNEFGIGMVRSVKSHDPNQNEVFNVNSSLYNRDFVKQAFDLLQVPVHYKRHFGNLEKIHAYAFAGLNMNFIMFTKFTFENKLLDGEMREDEVISKKSSFDDTVLSKGLFQGGDINKNIFLTADIGVGIEKRINNKNFFVETHFKKNVFASQLGPNKENLNSISFNVGSRIKI